MRYFLTGLLKLDFLAIYLLVHLMCPRNDYLKYLLDDFVANNSSYFLIN